MYIEQTQKQKHEKRAIKAVNTARRSNKMPSSKNKDRHHTYPKKHRKGRTETKIVNAREHNAFHQIVEDKDPVNALCYIILNFMPEAMQPLLEEVKKYGE